MPIMFGKDMTINAIRIILAIQKQDRKYRFNHF